MGHSQSVINVLTFTFGIVVITYIWRHRLWYLRAVAKDAAMRRDGQ